MKTSPVAKSGIFLVLNINTDPDTAAMSTRQHRVNNTGVSKVKIVVLFLCVLVDGVDSTVPIRTDP